MTGTAEQIGAQPPGERRASRAHTALGRFGEDAAARWLAERGYKVLHFYTEDFWGDEADLIQRIRNAWPGARSLLPVQVKPKGYTPTGPGRAVALPSDLQEAVDMLRRP
mgnify:CR=1 FL=1